MYPLDRLNVILDLCTLMGDGGCKVLILLLQLVIALGQLRFEPVYL